MTIQKLKFIFAKTIIVYFSLRAFQIVKCISVGYRLSGPFGSNVKMVKFFFKPCRHKVYKYFEHCVTLDILTYIYTHRHVSMRVLNQNTSSREFYLWAKLMPELNEPYLFSYASDVNVFLIFFYAVYGSHLYCLGRKRYIVALSIAKLTDTYIVRCLFNILKLSIKIKVFVYIKKKIIIKSHSFKHAFKLETIFIIKLSIIQIQLYKYWNKTKVIRLFTTVNNLDGDIILGFWWGKGV